MRHLAYKYSRPLEKVRVPVHALAHDTATDNFDLRGKRGPSLKDRRHRFNILTNSGYRDRNSVWFLNIQRLARKKAAV
jgi:hypothetical protein